MKKNLIIVFILIAQVAWAQTIKGKISDSETGEALFGANVYWATTTTGVTSAADGTFEIVKSLVNNRLVISFVGYQADTIIVSNESFLNIKLVQGEALEGVTVSASSQFIDRLQPIKTEVITAKELTKAACCNLSESFETNASIDVSFSDAVSGAKQIQMLGLDGTYTQIITENMPFVRGLANNYGLSYIPGTWIASIDVGKGAGSVVNGYESISGQINVELLKPEDSDPLFFNFYANSLGRLEGNVTTALKLGEKWSMGWLGHASTLQNKVDQNDDTFLDAPLFNQYNSMLRFKYDGIKYKSQFGIKALHEDRLGGQTNFQMSDRGTQNAYGMGLDVNRIEAFAKNALIFPNKPYMGLGLITSAIYNEQEAFYGLQEYKGTQKTLYANLIYQSIIGSTAHQFRAGASYLLDDYSESLNDSAFSRTESVPGVFGEYTYNSLTGFTAVLGLRADAHNLYGAFLTPRVHLKYDLGEHTALRASTGRGFRVPNPIGENLPLLASNRTVVISEKIRPEIAWNYGLSINQTFHLNNKDLLLDIEWFRTDFENQSIIDRDANSDLLIYYNLKGRSFANSMQVELSYQPIKSLTTKIAYKIYDVRATIDDELREVPMIARNRFFVNLGYATKFDIWKFDFTTKWMGMQRVPTDEVAHYAVEAPKSFAMVNAQITRSFRKWEIYLGGENLTNYKLKNPIIGADDPFGHGFDATMVWGPIVGTVIYTGVRIPVK